MQRGLFKTRLLSCIVAGRKLEEREFCITLRVSAKSRLVVSRMVCDTASELVAARARPDRRSWRFLHLPDHC